MQLVKIHVYLFLLIYYFNELINKKIIKIIQYNTKNY